MKLSVFFLYLLRIAEQENITLEKALIRAKNMGFTAIDIDKDELKMYPDAVSKIHDAGLIVRNVYGAYDLLNGEYNDAYELIDYAKKCGAKVAMLLPGAFNKEEFPEAAKTDAVQMQDFLSTNKKAQRALAAIKKTVAFAREKDIFLTIESFSNPLSLTSYLSQIEWLLDKADGLKFTFDIGNFYLNNQDIVLAYEKFASSTVHIHCKDYLEYPPVWHKDFSYKKIAAAVGAGQAPTKSIVKKFLKSGYEGYFTVEYLGVENALSIIKESADFLKTIS